MENFELSRRVLACAYRVHTERGPGLLESAYQACLVYELQKSGLHIEVQQPLPLIYGEIRLDCGYRLDIIVENALIIEIKAVEELIPVHVAQMITYLRISGIESGLLINFNVPSLKAGIRRLACRRKSRP